MESLKKISRQFRKEINIYKLVLKDKRTPIFAKIFLALALGYLLLPFDVIPDFIPVLGQLDDLIIVPLLVIIALKFIPKELIIEIRIKAK